MNKNEKSENKVCAQCNIEHQKYAETTEKEKPIHNELDDLYELNKKLIIELRRYNIKHKYCLERICELNLSNCQTDINLTVICDNCLEELKQ